VEKQKQRTIKEKKAGESKETGKQNFNKERKTGKKK